jgi:hypothetical protein
VPDESAAVVPADDPDVPTPPALPFSKQPVTVMMFPEVLPTCGLLVCAAALTMHPDAMATVAALQSLRFIWSLLFRYPVALQSRGQDVLPEHGR